MIATSLIHTWKKTYMSSAVTSVAVQLIAINFYSAREKLAIREDERVNREIGIWLGWQKARKNEA